MTAKVYKYRGETLFRNDKDRIDFDPGVTREQLAMALIAAAKEIERLDKVCQEKKYVFDE